MVVLVDMTGFGLIMPLLPYYAETFNAKPFVIGLLVASFAAASLIGAPLMGRLSDRHGRRPVLLLSVAGTFIGYMFLGFAPSIGSLLANLFASHAINAFTIGTLFFSRAIDGLTAGNITVAQAYISDVTDEMNRPRGLGLIGSAFGLGYIIGPALGGMLSRWSYQDPSFIAAGLAFLNMLSILFLLPESLSGEHLPSSTDQKNPSLTFHSLLSAFSRAEVGPLLLIRFLILLSYTIFWSLFALFAQIKLDLSTQSTGFVMTYIGFYSILVQGVGITILTKRFKDNAIIITSLWLLVLGFIGWSITSSLLLMLLVILPLSGGAWTLNTIITAAITKTVHPDEIGGLLGISAASDSITRLIGPVIGGFLLGSNPTWMPGVVCAAVVFLTIWLAYSQVIRMKGPTEPQLSEYESAETRLP
jgi:DHA1 family tetracycline resistance protein-like MFS transporter